MRGRPMAMSVRAAPARAIIPPTLAGTWSARDRVVWCLAGLWLLDAALQYQPFMFSRDFANQVIAPTAPGNPVVIARPIIWSTHVMLAHPAVWNGVFATLQLLLPIGLVLRRTRRATLAASALWAFGVWWAGEGFGGGFAGTAAPWSGAPGAAALYLLVAVLVWPGLGATDGPVAFASPLGPRGARIAWSLLWVSFAYQALLPANRAADGLSSAISTMANGEPGWVGALDRAAAALVAHDGLPIAIGLAVLCVGIAAGIWVTRGLRPVLGVAVVIALFIWVVGENFGAVLTGSGTDPNSGPQLLLLAFAFWPARVAYRRPAQVLDAIRRPVDVRVPRPARGGARPDKTTR